MFAYLLLKWLMLKRLMQVQSWSQLSSVSWTRYSQSSFLILNASFPHSWRNLLYSNSFSCHTTLIFVTVIFAPAHSCSFYFLFSHYLNFRSAKVEKFSLHFSPGSPGYHWHYHSSFVHYCVRISWESTLLKLRNVTVLQLLVALFLQFSTRSSFLSIRLLYVMRPSSITSWCE